MKHHLLTLSAIWLCLSISFIDARDYCIRQKNIPFVITHPGEYHLVENIVFDGSGSAITIQADNVKLDLETFSITLTDNNATGILVQNVSEFEIKSDLIKNISLNPQNGFGIHIINATKGTIKNVFTLFHFNGLCIESSNNICIHYSRFSSAVHSGAYVVDSTNIIFENSVFVASGNGLTFSGANKDCMISNSEFPSATFSNLLVQQMDGMLIENCLFTNVAGDPTKANLVQFGDADPAQLCHDIIFKKCTLVNRPAHTPTLGNTAPEGLGIYQGSGFLVDSCLIDIDNTNQDPTIDLSGIHISNPGLGLAGTIASDVTIRNCIIQGPATNGLYPDVGSSGIVIDNCLVTSALKDGIFLAGTTTSIVKNNTVVNNGTNGIFLGETSVANAVNNNLVSNNGFNPILTSLSPTGNGISIALDSSSNIVQYNQVFDNNINGIDDQGTGNQIYNNVAYANGSNNYFAATDTIIVSHPGDPVKTAQNIAL